LSEKCYDSEGPFKDAILPISNKSWNIKFFNFGGTQAYALSGNNNFILTFRGTQPNEWQDIKADLDVKKVNSSTIEGHVEGRVHRGFKYALNDVWKDVVEHMEKCNTNQKQVYITGHSLGAALATLVAGRLNNPDVVLYTYGSPRAGDKKWNSMQKFTHYRFRNNNDLVTRIPPAFMGFRHNGKFMYFDTNSEVTENPKFTKKLVEWFKGMIKGIFTFSFDSFSDHDISTYHKLCKNQEMK
jgi:triacylglycerol lipase